MQYDENGMIGRIIKSIPNNIVLPCTQRTSFSQSVKGGKETYKYNGSLCGASFAIPQIAGLFLLARQVDKSISFNEFIKIVRDTAKLNKDNMKYLDAEGIITKVIEMEKGKKILESGIRATEGVRTGAINGQAQTIKSVEKAKTQENVKANEEVS